MAPFLLPFIMLATLVRELVRLFRDERYRAILMWIAVLLLVGTIFYTKVEGWSPLDSFYFTVVTLATVGYGDFAPTTPESKIFTVVYIFLGMSFFITFISLLAKQRQALYQQRHPGAQEAKDEQDVA